MKRLLKHIDQNLLGQRIRRSRLNARRILGDKRRPDVSEMLRARRRELAVAGEDILFTPEPPRFIGGTTGRSGTRWLVRLMKAQFSTGPVVIDEVGVFVMALLREAPYEYYQLGTDNAAWRREAYLDYFLKQMKRYAFQRRRMYGAGMRGLSDYVPERALVVAGQRLKEDLSGQTQLAGISRSFGNFYVHLLNYHAAIVRGGASSWVSKEPPYGRHADELFCMVPEGKLVVLLRDGRASALSMYKRRWMDSVRACMERWGTFAEMTLEAVERSPSDRVLLVRYEDLVRDFKAQLSQIHRFLDLPAPDLGLLESHPDASLRPQPESLDRWQREVTTEDAEWFGATYGGLMERLGYER
jgi:hypothetical protein